VQGYTTGSITITVPGVYTVYANHVDGGVNCASTATQTLTITQHTTSVSVTTPSSVAAAGTVSFSATVTDAVSGSLVSGAVVVFTTNAPTVPGCTATAVAGVASCSVVPTGEASYKLTATYAGDSQYLNSVASASSSSSVTCQSLSVVYTMNPVQQPAVTQSISLSVKDANSNAVSGRTIRITVRNGGNNVVFAANTVSDAAGNVVFNAPLHQLPGQYVLAASHVDDGRYCSATPGTILTVVDPNAESAHIAPTTKSHGSVLSKILKR